MAATMYKKRFALRKGGQTTRTYANKQRINTSDFETPRSNIDTNTLFNKKLQHERRIATDTCNEIFDNLPSILSL